MRTPWRTSVEEHLSLGGMNQSTNAFTRRVSSCLISGTSIPASDVLSHHRNSYTRPPIKPGFIGVPRFLPGYLAPADWPDVCLLSGPEQIDGPARLPCGRTSRVRSCSVGWYDRSPAV